MQIFSKSRTVSALIASLFVFTNLVQPATTTVAAEQRADHMITEQMNGGVFVMGPRNGNPTSEHVWDSPDVSGVLIRIPWNRINPEKGVYEFDFIGHELDQAIAHGKKVTLVIGAGYLWTPDWIFTEGHVAQHTFIDHPHAHPESDSCGIEVTLGSPTDPAYRFWYFSAIRALGTYVQTNPAWFDAVAYVKPSGANFQTYENMLPKRAEPGCLNNAQVWAEAGYTPEGIVEFYEKQMRVIQAHFPEKPMIYALIQDGFPKTNNDGGYILSDGTSSDGQRVFSGVTQTEHILAMGQATYPNLFITSHNGARGHKDLNPWVLEAGNNGYNTSFQTVNMEKLDETYELQQTFDTIWNTSTAHYVEIYDDLLKYATWDGGQLTEETHAISNTLSGWNEAFASRAPSSATQPSSK